MVESHLSTKVELFLCARNLINKDTFSKSDPFCIVMSSANTSHGYHEVGRTEIIRDNLNPNWKTTIILDYFFEMNSLNGRKWLVQGSCACNGQGLYEGLDWLSRVVTGKQN